MTKITYVGLERCDFVYHLALILSLQGSVLVIDNSYNLDLIDAVSTDGTREMREWKNIVFAADVDLKTTDTSDFEYVLVYAGLATKENSVAEDNFTLIMPDFTKMAIEAVKDLDDMAKPIYIFRDKCTKKYTAKSLAMLLGINRKDIVGAMNVSAQDLGAYVSLTHNHYSNVKFLSDEMVESLKYVIGEIFGIGNDYKKINKIIKHAKKVK